METIGVVALTVGLAIAVAPKRHPTLEDPTLRGLGWTLAVVSLLLLLTGTLAPPLANDQAPTAPAPSGSSPVYREEPSVPTGTGM